MAAIMKLCRQVGNPTPSIDAYLLEKNPAKFYPDPIWNYGALGFFEESPPNNKRIEELRKNAR